MVMEMQSQELQQKHFLRQLAACVKRIQWIYAIFWSKSSRVVSSLEWNDGYYNGDIKTRKTTQQNECSVDEMGLQRSEQLRELYESLCIGDCNQQTRPTASLSPEDLTDKEWYYLVCMSFTFNFGQDLPGKAYERNEPIWLNNAQFAENSCFCRSLLAKSASIQTIVCLPFMDGVLELGTTELVMEEPDFLHNITNSFWELQLPGFSEHSMSSSPSEREDDDVCLISNHEVQDTIMSENRPLIMENDSHLIPFSIDSYAPNIDSDLIHYKEIIGFPEHRSNVPDEPSQVQIRHLIDEFSDGLNSSLNFSECVSPKNILCSPKGEQLKGNIFNHSREDNRLKFGSLGMEEDGSHYFSTLSAILRDLKQGRSSPGFPFQNRLIDSSFRVWEKSSKSSIKFIRFPQRMLKKILFGRNWINGDEWVKPHEENVPRNKAFKSEADDANSNHVLSERRRREKLNEKFVTLRSLVPSISRVDKASILADTIEYLKALEKRIEELEFCREEEMGTDMRERRKHPDITERTSDNYGNNDLIISQNSPSNKRRSHEMDDSEAQLNLILSNNGLFDINVTMIDREVLIELHCPWRDFLLLDIIEALCNLRLDPHSVRSSTADPTTVIALRAKIMSTTDTSPGMIKRSLQRVIGKGRINLFGGLGSVWDSL